jgi:hypothetical protein
MIHVDLMRRGVPWVELLLRGRMAPATLNLGWRHRASAASCLVFVAALSARRWRRASGSALAFVLVNRRFYARLLRRRGPGGAVAGVALHALHHLIGVAAVPVGAVRYVRARGR